MDKKTAKVLLPIIRKNYPKMMAKQITGVQAIGPGVGGIFNMDNELEWSKWRRTFSLWPRRSVTGKLIFGRINKSSRDDWGVRPGPGKEVMILPERLRLGRRPKRIRRFATDKELFTAKLKGET